MYRLSFTTNVNRGSEQKRIYQEVGKDNVFIAWKGNTAIILSKTDSGKEWMTMYYLKNCDNPVVSFTEFNSDVCHQ
jgi:hypothetical protein